MNDFFISTDQAKQFAFDCFDVIVRDIKEMEEEEGKDVVAEIQGEKIA